MIHEIAGVNPDCSPSWRSSIPVDSQWAGRVPNLQEVCCKASLDAEKEAGLSFCDKVNSTVVGISTVAFRICVCSAPPLGWDRANSIDRAKIIRYWGTFPRCSPLHSLIDIFLGKGSVIRVLFCDNAQCLPCYSVNLGNFSRNQEGNYGLQNEIKIGDLPLKVGPVSKHKW